MHQSSGGHVPAPLPSPLKLLPNELTEVQKEHKGEGCSIAVHASLIQKLWGKMKAYEAYYKEARALRRLSIRQQDAIDQLKGSIRWHEEQEEALRRSLTDEEARLLAAEEKLLARIKKRCCCPCHADFERDREAWAEEREELLAEIARLRGELAVERKENEIRVNQLMGELAEEREEKASAIANLRHQLTEQQHAVESLQNKLTKEQTAKEDLQQQLTASENSSRQSLSLERLQQEIEARQEQERREAEEAEVRKQREDATRALAALLRKAGIPRPHKSLLHGEISSDAMQQRRLSAASASASSPRKLSNATIEGAHSSIDDDDEDDEGESSGGGDFMSIYGRRLQRIPLAALHDCVKKGADVLFHVKGMPDSLLSMFMRAGLVNAVQQCLSSPFPIDFTATPASLMIGEDNVFDEPEENGDSRLNTPLHYISPIHTPQRTKMLLTLVLDRLDRFTGVARRIFERTGRVPPHMRRPSLRTSTTSSATRSSIATADDAANALIVDIVDWEQKNVAGNDFLSMAACAGKLSLVWKMVKERGVPYFIDRPIPFPPLTFRVFKRDWEGIPPPDRSKFQPALGFL